MKIYLNWLCFIIEYKNLKDIKQGITIIHSSVEHKFLISFKELFILLSDIIFILIFEKTLL